MTAWMLWAFAVGFCCGGALFTQRWISRDRQLARELAKPLRVPVRVARCVPQLQTPATQVQVLGARETYSHPRADEVLRQRQLWTPGGSA